MTNHFLDVDNMPIKDADPSECAHVIEHLHFKPNKTLLCNGCQRTWNTDHDKLHVLGNDHHLRRY